MFTSDTDHNEKLLRERYMQLLGIRDIPDEIGKSLRRCALRETNFHKAMLAEDIRHKKEIESIEARTKEMFQEIQKTYGISFEELETIPQAESQKKLSLERLEMHNQSVKIWDEVKDLVKHIWSTLK